MDFATYEKWVSTKFLNRIPKPIRIFITESLPHIVNITRLDVFYLSWRWREYIKLSAYFVNLNGTK